VARLNTDLALAGCDDSRTIRTNEAALAGFQIVLDLQHVHHRNTFGDGNDDGNARLDGFQNGIRAEGRRHKNHGCIGAGLLDRFRHRVENRDAFHVLAAFAGGNTGHHVRAISLTVHGVELTFTAGNALNH